jgi:2-dehydropantoate 2-reductase
VSGGIAVVGVGAIGGVCAAHLLEAGASPLCCVRTPFEELVVETGAGALRFRPRVATDPARVADPAGADWLLLATKAHQTDGAAPWLEALVGERTRVAVLHNGVEHVERLSPWVAAERLVPVVVMCPATATGPGRIVQQADARLTVPAGDAGRAFAALFAGSRVRVDASDAWPTEAWRKLCLNVTSGPLAALAGLPLPRLHHPERGALALALALECARVARAEGADVPDDFARGVASRVATARKGGTPSTLTDRLLGRPLEWDARNGAVVRIGARHGIDTPANARAAELLREVHRAGDADWLPRLAEVLTDGPGGS